jgi:hypothetical protein
MNAQPVPKIISGIVGPAAVKRQQYRRSKCTAERVSVIVKIGDEASR